LDKWIVGRVNGGTLEYWNGGILEKWIGEVRVALTQFE
jgi:hypothetical protein